MRLDPKILREIEALARAQLELADQLRKAAGRSILEELDSGEILSTDAAGEIAGVTAEAVRNRCEETEQEGCPIGRKLGKMWLVSRLLWLADIERRKGTHERLAAETRSRKRYKISEDPEIDRE